MTGFTAFGKAPQLKKIDNIRVKVGDMEAQLVQFQNHRILYGLLHEECLPHQQIVLSTVLDVMEDSAHEIIPGSEYSEDSCPSPHHVKTGLL